MRPSRAGLTWLFEPDPTCVGVARRHVREVLAAAASDPELAWLTGWLDTAQLAVSEVVTNALVHAGTPIELVLSVEPATVRVDVLDGSLSIPHPRAADGAIISGRGLSLVAEVASRWGVDQHPYGKAVWFELWRDPSTASTSTDASVTLLDPDGEHEASCAIVLRNVPLLLHAAWQEQAAAILRDYLLTSIEEDLEVLERHAAASTVLSLLAEQIPPPPVARAAGSGVVVVGQPPESATAEEVVLQVPVSQVPAFEVMDHLLDAAIWSAHAGAFATPPVLAEVIAMRRWVCAEVRTQARGSDVVVPWRLADVVEEPNWSQELAWPSQVVTDADEVAGAVSDDGFVLALSRAASTLMAQRWPDGVVGRRFVALVQPAHRQRVLAAFTYQLATERGLVGDRVPLRDLGVQDGWGTWSLAVEPIRSAAGRWVFVVRLHPPGA